MTAPLLVADLGRRDYLAVLELQRELCRRRVEGTLAHDLLLLVEHDPVITLGRGFKPSSLPDGGAALRARGVPIVEVERGGDITWHGPGQLVGYPIVHLSAMREDLHWYLRTLEEGLIQALARLGVPAETRPGLTGVWTGGAKIASIGIHVKRWVTFHGFALNVTTVPASWSDFVPCGIDGVRMTSVAEALGQPPHAELRNRSRDAVVYALGRVLQRMPLPAPSDLLSPEGSAVP